MPTVKNTANCGIMADAFKAAGKWHPYTETPKRGWVVFYDWAGGHTKRDHTGIVESVSGSSVVAIEGNTAVGNDSNGGEVMRRTRSVAYITGYGDPGYASDDEREAIIARAAGQIGTKESPANSNKVLYNTWYYGKAVSGSAYPWCAVFVSWVFNASGATASAVVGAAVNLTLNLIKQGSTGPQVKALQRMLYSMYGSIVVDGDFGAKTSAAVKRYQTANGLDADGEVGQKTWTSLLKGGA